MECVLAVAGWCPDGSLRPKGLSLLEHIIKNGNERSVEDARDHMHKIRSLTDFNFYEGTIDRGNGGE